MSPQSDTDSPMRILHVIRTVNPAWGGPVEGLRNLTAQARCRGHEPEIVSADEPGAQWLPSWSLKVHAVGPAQLGIYGITKNLDEWLNANLSRFDIVVVHGIWMYFSYAVWKATRRTGVPYFLFIHGALDPWFKRTYPLKHLKKVAYWKLFEHKVLRDAQAVLYTTEEEMILADRAFLPWRSRSAVSGYGIAPPALSEAFDKDQVIRRLTGSNPALRNRKFILFLARIHEKKGIDLLLKAFAAARPGLPGTALVIAGPGEEKTLGKLRQLASSLGISEDVVWTGPLYGDAKYDTLRAAEAYVLPSHQENFGISVVEALACGTPVLISDKVNIWREIQSANCGLVAPDDVPGAARLLQQWAAVSDQQKLQMGSNAKQCFSRNFDLEVTSDRFFSLLASGSGVRSQAA